MQEENEEQVLSLFLRLSDIFAETIDQKLLSLLLWHNDTFYLRLYLWIVEYVRINHRDLLKTQLFVESASDVVAQLAY